jgi:hypothetical protein
MVDKEIKQLHTHDRIFREISYKIESGAGYIDALVEYAKKYDIDPEALGKIVKRSVIFKSKLREEAIKLNIPVPHEPETEQLCD